MLRLAKKTIDAINPLHLGKRLSRKKRDPFQFEFTGEATPIPPSVQLFSYTADTVTEHRTFDLGKGLDTLHDKNTMHWLNVHGLHDVNLITDICKHLNVHALVIQDILDVNQRPKLQDFEQFLFFTIKSIVPGNEMLVTEHISFVMGKNLLLSFQEKEGDHFEHLRYRLRENVGILRQRGPDYLLFTLLEAILDTYFTTLQQLELEVEHMKDSILTVEASPNLIEQIERNKKRVHLIRKVIQPIKDVTVMLERDTHHLIEKRHLKYFFEIKDLCLTLLDTCETIDNTLQSSTNLFFSMQGHKLNQVMKTLTIVATIFIPLTFIAGIYGMNFTNMPELEWKYGYFSVWLGFLTISFTMLFLFKRKKWF